MRYLIQTRQGATLYAYKIKKARDRKLQELQQRYPRTVYITKEIA